MKKSTLLIRQKNTLSQIFVFLCIAMFGFSSCSDSSDLEYEVQVFQQQVDSILVSVIVPKKDSLHAQINNNKDLSQASIDIAYQVIPINTAQFLISSQADTLSQSLKLFKSKKIKAKELQEKLNYSKFYVDSILVSNVVKY